MSHENETRKKGKQRALQNAGFGSGKHAL